MFQIVNFSCLILLLLILGIRTEVVETNSNGNSTATSADIQKAPEAEEKEIVQDSQQTKYDPPAKQGPNWTLGGKVAALKGHATVAITYAQNAATYLNNGAGKFAEFATTSIEAAKAVPEAIAHIKKEANENARIVLDKLDALPNCVFKDFERDANGKYNVKQILETGLAEEKNAWLKKIITPKTALGLETLQSLTLAKSIPLVVAEYYGKSVRAVRMFFGALFFFMHRQGPSLGGLRTFADLLGLTQEKFATIGNDYKTWIQRCSKASLLSVLTLSVDEYENLLPEDTKEANGTSQTLPTKEEVPPTVEPPKIEASKPQSTSRWGLGGLGNLVSKSTAVLSSTSVIAYNATKSVVTDPRAALNTVKDTTTSYLSAAIKKGIKGIWTDILDDVKSLIEVVKKYFNSFMELKDTLLGKLEPGEEYSFENIAKRKLPVDKQWVAQFLTRENFDALRIFSTMNMGSTAIHFIADSYFNVVLSVRALSARTTYFAQQDSYIQNKLLDFLNKLAPPKFLATILCKAKDSAVDVKKLARYQLRCEGTGLVPILALQVPLEEQPQNTSMFSALSNVTNFVIQANDVLGTVSQALGHMNTVAKDGAEAIMRKFEELPKCILGEFNRDASGNYNFKEIIETGLQGEKTAWLKHIIVPETAAALKTLDNLTLTQAVPLVVADFYHEDILAVRRFVGDLFFNIRQNGLEENEIGKALASVLDLKKLSTIDENREIWQQRCENTPLLSILALDVTEFKPQNAVLLHYEPPAQAQDKVTGQTPKVPTNSEETPKKDAQKETPTPAAALDINAETVDTVISAVPADAIKSALTPYADDAMKTGVGKVFSDNLEDILGLVELAKKYYQIFADLRKTLLGDSAGGAEFTFENLAKSQLPREKQWVLDFLKGKNFDTLKLVGSLNMGTFGIHILADSNYNRVIPIRKLTARVLFVARNSTNAQKRLESFINNLELPDALSGKLLGKDKPTDVEIDTAKLANYEDRCERKRLTDILAFKVQIEDV